jgi:hypothetical protein
VPAAPAVVSELAEFWVHQVTIETYRGTNGAGVKVYAAPQTDDVFVEGKTRLVRDGNGAQVVSQATLYGDVSLGALLPPLSRVTLPDGRVTTVLSTNTNDSGSLGLPDHVAVSLQ